MVRLARHGAQQTTDVKLLARRAGTTSRFYYSLSDLEQRAIRLGAGVAPSNWVNSGDTRAVASCESGGDPSRVGSGGAFNGKFQFTMDTWAG
ncbi:transglycosylase family protein, partial [Candidatus Saccharibacteria bacterium]|nr:transglycosylase family protein [Candidatus Saccharibacteria bacterium]